MENKKLTSSLVASLLIATNLYSAEELSSITVTSATKSEQSIEDITSNVDVITSDELEERHFTSLADALNSLPGISFTSNGGIGSTISLSLRGTSNNRTLILIDGIKFKDHSSISGTDISTLMITDIERIEIIKGAQSGIWGADGAAGVINIITKSAENNSFNGNIFTEIGSFNTKKYGTQLSYGNKSFDIKFDAQRISTDSFTSRAPKGTDLDKYEDDKYENTTLNLKSNYYINDNTKINFFVTDIDSLKEYDGFSGPNDTLMKNDSKSRIYNLGYNQKYKNHDFILNLNKANIKRDQIGTTWGVKLTNNDTKNIELKDKISYDKKDYLVIGLGGTEDKINFTRADDSSNNASNKTKYFFLTNSNHFNDLILTESLRYDKFNNFDNKITGKLGAKYNISKEFYLFSNIGTAYSVPLLIKNINPWGMTNFDIKPEESKSFDLGFDYKNFKFTYFHQKVTDLIDWYDPTPTDYYNNDAIYRNLDGEAKFKGIELSYKKEVFSDTLLSLNYTRLSAKDKDGKYLARKPNQNLKVGLDYYGISNFHLNLNAEYVGQRYNNYDKAGEQTGKYTLWNIVANSEINKNVSTYIKLDNIFNKDYQIVDGYATAPRSAYIGLKYKF